MPCSKCKSDFNLLNWKIKCGECEEKYCNKCLKRREGVLFCEKCLVLLKRPPDRGKLMELKPKDLQIYLKKHNISTHGLVEKHELVDLFCNKHVPVKQRRGTEKLTANFSCSLPSSSLGEFWGTINNDFWNGTREQQPPATSPNNSNQNFESTLQPQPPPPTSTYEHGTPSSSTTTIPQENPSNSANTESISKENHTPQETPTNRVKCPKLTEIESENDLQQLTAKQLKMLLTLNRVDYKGCVERRELLDKAVILWRDTTMKLKDDLPEEFDDICKLCMDAPLDCVLLECGHIVSCIECGKRLAECPVCRQYVTRVVRTFKA